jgi:hypothetical protein
MTVRPLPVPARLSFAYKPVHPASNPNACTCCGTHCDPGDLVNSIPRPDGTWVCLTCVLKAGGSDRG